MTEPKHTVTFAPHKGWANWTMHCPFDAADRKRPCWPDDEDGKPAKEAEGQRVGCNWREWFENVDEVESIEEATPITWAVDEALWKGEGVGFAFTLVPES